MLHHLRGCGEGGSDLPKNCRRIVDDQKNRKSPGKKIDDLSYLCRAEEFGDCRQTRLIGVEMPVVEIEVAKSHGRNDGGNSNTRKPRHIDRGYDGSVGQLYRRHLP